MHWATLRGWMSGDWKLIAGPHPELFDLSNDPDERHDRSSEQPDRVQRMNDQLVRALTRIAPGGDRAQTNPISAEQEQRLRSLGYAAGSGGSGPLDDPTLPDPRTRVALYERAAMAATLGRELESPSPDAPGFELGFKVDSCDAAYAELVSDGATPVVSPTDRAWRQRTAYVRDPDGYLVELAEDLGR